MPFTLKYLFSCYVDISLIQPLMQHGLSAGEIKDYPDFVSNLPKDVIFNFSLDICENKCDISGVEGESTLADVFVLCPDKANYWSVEEKKYFFSDRKEWYAWEDKKFTLCSKPKKLIHLLPFFDYI